MKKDSISTSKEWVAMQKMISCRNLPVGENEDVQPFSEEELQAIGSAKDHTTLRIFLSFFSEIRQNWKKRSNKTNQKVEQFFQSINKAVRQKLEIVNQKIIQPVVKFLKWVDHVVFGYLERIGRRIQKIYERVIAFLSPYVLPLIRKIKQIFAWQEKKIC